MDIFILILSVYECRISLYTYTLLQFLSCMFQFLWKVITLGASEMAHQVKVLATKLLKSEFHSQNSHSMKTNSHKVPFDLQICVMTHTCTQTCSQIIVIFSKFSLSILLFLVLLYMDFSLAFFFFFTKFTVSEWN